MRDKIVAELIAKRTFFCVLVWELGRIIAWGGPFDTAWVLMILSCR